MEVILIPINSFYVPKITIFKRTFIRLETDINKDYKNFAYKLGNKY